MKDRHMNYRFVGQESEVRVGYLVVSAKTSHEADVSVSNLKWVGGQSFTGTRFLIILPICLPLSLL
jgi:hypothetical protein